MIRAKRRDVLTALGSIIALLIDSKKFPLDRSRSPFMGRQLLSGAWPFSDAILQRCRVFSSTLTGSPLFSCTNQRQFSPLSRSSERGRLSTRNAALLRAQVHKVHRSFATMTSAEGQLPVSVESLSLHSTTEKSKFPDCFPSLNPVDVYRAHIAEKLGEVTGIEPEKIYPRLQWTNTLDKGDLVLPVSIV